MSDQPDPDGWKFLAGLLGPLLVAIGAGATKAVEMLRGRRKAVADLDDLALRNAAAAMTLQDSVVDHLVAAQTEAVRDLADARSLVKKLQEEVARLKQGDGCEAERAEIDQLSAKIRRQKDHIDMLTDRLTKFCPEDRP